MAARDKVVRSRNYRKQRRQDRRLEVFGMEYLLLKYPVIRSEIEAFFNRINNKYPGKNNLTKTPEFMVWKSDLEMSATASGQGQESSTITTVMASGQGQEVSASSGQGQEASAATASGQGQEPSAVTTAMTSAVTTATTSGQGQETSTVTTTATGHVLGGEYPALCDLDTGATATVGDEDPWLCGLDIDSREIAELIDELNQDPELQAIMDTFPY